jgi:hypothetical protein
MGEDNGEEDDVPDNLGEILYSDDGEEFELTLDENNDE